jgi:hypothetical protein
MRAMLPLVLFLASCMTGDGLQNKLRDATNEYNMSLRWYDIDRAAAWLPAASQRDFMEHYGEFDEELVVVDYELSRLDLDKNTGIARSRATISWHTDRELILRTTSIDQVWQYHEGRFVLVDERRAGGEPLALFAERGEPHPWLPGLQRYRVLHKIGKDNRHPRRNRAARAQQAARSPGGASPGS